MIEEQITLPYHDSHPVQELWRAEFDSLEITNLSDSVLGDATVWLVHAENEDGNIRTLIHVRQTKVKSTVVFNNYPPISSLKVTSPEDKTLNLKWLP